MTSSSTSQRLCRGKKPEHSRRERLASLSPACPSIRPASPYLPRSGSICRALGQALCAYHPRDPSNATMPPFQRKRNSSPKKFKNTPEAPLVVI